MAERGVVKAGMAGRVARAVSVTIPYRCVFTMLGNVDRPGPGGMPWRSVARSEYRLGRAH